MHTVTILQCLGNSEWAGVVCTRSVKTQHSGAIFQLSRVAVTNSTSVALCWRSDGEEWISTLSTSFSCPARWSPRPIYRQLAPAKPAFWPLVLWVSPEKHRGETQTKPPFSHFLLAHGTFPLYLPNGREDRKRKKICVLHPRPCCLTKYEPWLLFLGFKAWDTAILCWPYPKVPVTWALAQESSEHKTTCSDCLCSCSLQAGWEGSTYQVGKDSTHTLDTQHDGFWDSSLIAGPEA